MVQQYNLIGDYPEATGVLGLLFSIRDGIPFAFEGLMFGIFILLFGSLYFVTKTRTGRAKIFQSLFAASMASMILAMLLALGTLVTFKTVLLYAFLTILSFIFLVISDNQ